MIQTVSVYLFREVTLGTHVDFCRVDSESIFFEKNKAMAFAESAFKKMKPDHSFYRYELITLPLGYSSGFYEKEVFGTSGRRLRREIFNQDGYSEEVFTEFVSVPAESGAVCLLAKNIENQHSCFTHEKIGVVTGKDATDDGVEYTIHYLSDEGIWGHTHTLNPCIKKVIEEPVDMIEKIVSLSASMLFNWQSGSSIGESMSKFLAGDIPWFHVPELISLGLKK